MNQINPNKLNNSKWTAVTPINKEKHFLITQVEYDEERIVISCTLEAIMSKHEYQIDWKTLKNNEKWRQGWK